WSAGAGGALPAQCRGRHLAATRVGATARPAPRVFPRSMATHASLRSRAVPALHAGDRGIHNRRRATATRIPDCLGWVRADVRRSRILLSLVAPNAESRVGLHRLDGLDAERGRYPLVRDGGVRQTPGAGRRRAAYRGRPLAVADPA